MIGAAPSGVVYVMADWSVWTSRAFSARTMASSCLRCETCVTHRCKIVVFVMYVSSHVGIRLRSSSMYCEIVRCRFFSLML